jgi:hypothetical protein
MIPTGANYEDNHDYNSPLAGLSGGSDLSNNNKDNGNGKSKSKQPQQQQQKQETNKRYEYVQKYSNDRLLAEAIIVDGNPCFAVVNRGDDGGTTITIQEQISLNDSRKTILRAPDVSSYINKPYSFASISEFEDYIENARNKTLDSLYRKVKRTGRRISTQMMFT